jgi:adenylate kinase family enzyme
MPKCCDVVFIYCFIKYFQLDEMLEKKGTKIDKVLNFAIDDAILEERITGRWIHPSSGRSYHTKFAPPKVPGVDDVSRRVHILCFVNPFMALLL